MYQRKKQAAVFLLALVVSTTAMLTGCKKSNTPPPPDYAALLMKDTWAGEYQKTGYAFTHPFELQFGVDNSVLFREYGGERAAAWSLDQNKITFSFGPPSYEKITALIENNKLTGFRNITAHNWVVVNAGQSAAFSQSLDNTVWNAEGVTSATRNELKFLPGGNLEYGAIPAKYTRKGGAVTGTFTVVLTGVKIFLVLLPDNTIRGVVGDSQAFVATKK